MCSDLKEFFERNDKICLIRCPKGEKKDKISKKYAIHRDTENKYENENGFYVKNCSDTKAGYFYHKKNKF